MKKPIVIAFVLQIAISLQLLPQSSFEITISNEKDQVINSVIENDEGDFVMVGRIHDDKTGIAGGYILKVDCNGRLLSESIFQSEDTTSCLFFNIHYFNDFYYLLGSKSIGNTDQSALWYLKLNSKLEVENEKLLGIPNGRWFSYMNSIIDSDSNFVLAGYTTAYQTYPSYVHNPFYYKLSATGDSLNTEFIYTSSIWTVPFDLIESRDSTSYHVFYSRYDDTSPGHMLTGYFGSICASDFGVCVPVISVQTVPLFTVRFVPL